MNRILLSVLLVPLQLSVFAQAPELVKDINPGATGIGMYSFNQFKEFNGWLYFGATTPATGMEVYRTDGKTVGLALDSAPGTIGGFSGMTLPMFNVYKGKLYYAAGNGASSGIELYATDSSGTGRLMYALGGGCTLCAQGFPKSFAQFNNLLFFSGDTTTSAGAAQELYVYDGISRPVRINANIHALAGGSQPKHLTRFNGRKGDRLYFNARLNATTWSLHEYDAAGNVREVIGARGISKIQPPVVVGSNMYFAGWTPTYGLELYRFDGDTAQRLTDLAPGPKAGLNGEFDYVFSPCQYKENLYFAGSTDSVSFQLYALNLQTNVVQLAATINPAGSGMVSNLFVYQDALYFTAFTPATGYELHRYDGKSVQLVADIWPGTKSGFGLHGLNRYAHPGFSEFKGQLYFAANDSIHNLELWRLGKATNVSKLSWAGKALVVPNPAYGDATLDLALPRAEKLGITLTDITGRAVHTMPAVDYPAGESHVRLPIQALAPGTYLYRISTSEGGAVASGKIIH